MEWVFIVTVAIIILSAFEGRGWSLRKLPPHPRAMERLQPLAGGIAEFPNLEEELLTSELPLFRLREEQPSGFHQVRTGVIPTKRWNDVRAAVFEYRIRQPKQDKSAWLDPIGATIGLIADSASGDFFHYLGAVIQVPVSVPVLTLRREALWSRIADQIGLRDVQIHDRLFDRTFTVKCGDQEFCQLFLDEGVRQWLLGLRGRCIFELAGDKLLAYVEGKWDTGRAAALLDAATEFSNRIPSEAIRQYPRT